MTTNTTRNCLLEPQLYQIPAVGVDSIEISVHYMPKQWKSDFSFVDDLVGEVVGDTGVLLVLTSQPAKLDLLKVSPETNEERDLLLEKFFAFSELLKKELSSLQKTNVTIQKQGKVKKIWSDYCDPCSGLLYRTKSCPVIFPEVAFFEKLRRFNSLFLCGACKVAIHPTWKTKFYPATFFTTASADDIKIVCFHIFLITFIFLGSD